MLDADFETPNFSSERTYEAQLLHDGRHAGRDHAQILPADQHVGALLQSGQRAQRIPPPQSILAAVVVVVVQPGQVIAPALWQLREAARALQAEPLHQARQVSSSGMMMRLLRSCCAASRFTRDVSPPHVRH